MPRKTKAVILAAFATLALSAVGASLAQAEKEVDAVFKGGHTENASGEEELTNTTLTGKQEGNPFEANQFNTAAGEFSCTNTGVDLQATVAEEENRTLTVTPTYDECENEAGSPAIIDTNGCDYTFLSPDTTIEGGDFTGEAELYCPENEAIELILYLFGNHETHSFKTCTITVAPTEGTHHLLGGHIVYENKLNIKTERDFLTAYATLEEVPYEAVGFCPNEQTTDGTYESTVRFEGVSDGESPHEEPLDVWLDH